MITFAEIGNSFVLSNTGVVLFVGGTGVGVGGYTTAGWQTV
jgi:Tfp pilus assembly ATPase PilU